MSQISGIHGVKPKLSDSLYGGYMNIEKFNKQMQQNQSPSLAPLKKLKKAEKNQVQNASAGWDVWN